jgi:hypothetical protein
VRLLRSPSSFAVFHFEVATSLWAIRRGWRLIYDPTACVDHYVAPRFDTDARRRPRSSALRDAAYNLVFSMLAIEPDLYWRRAAYGLAIGDRGHPGVVRAAVGALRGEADVVRSFVPSIIGQAEALVDVARGRRLVLLTSDGVGIAIATKATGSLRGSSVVPHA